MIPGPPAQLSTTTPASSQSASVPGTAATSALTPSAATAMSGKRTVRLDLIRSALNTGGLATYIQSVQPASFIAFRGLGCHTGNVGHSQSLLVSYRG